MDQEGTYANQVKSILEELNQASISIGNCKKYFDKIRNTEQIITAQIENNKTDYNDQMARFKDMTGKQSFKDGYDQGIVSAKLYDHVKDMNKTLQDTYGWRSLQKELNSLFLDKVMEIVGETKALDIERDALNRFSAMQKQEHQFLSELMQKRYQVLEDKFNYFVSTVTDKMNEERNNMLEVLKEVLKKAPEQVKRPEDIPTKIEKPQPPQQPQEPQQEKPQPSYQPQEPQQEKKFPASWDDIPEVKEEKEKDDFGGL